jgi:hypothetical protein
MRRLSMAVLAVLFSIDTAAFAGSALGQSQANLPTSSFEAGTDSDDGLADRFWSITGANLALRFSLIADGQADAVEIVIRDSAGKTVLDTKSDGALLFAKLPEGDYVIEAIFAGRVIVRPVTLFSYQTKLYIDLYDDHVAAVNNRASSIDLKIAVVTHLLS